MSSSKYISVRYGKIYILSSNWRRSIVVEKRMESSGCARSDAYIFPLATYGPLGMGSMQMIGRIVVACAAIIHVRTKNIAGGVAMCMQENTGGGCRMVGKLHEEPYTRNDTKGVLC